jgi:hypothetical protein
LNIRYLTYQDIDKKKWDACITNAANGLIYAESMYLDQMAGIWDAIVLDDYKAVMPLPWRKKMGIKYLYQPAFFQQGGIFSTVVLSNEIVRIFLDIASSHFKFGEITLNYANNFGELQNNIIIKKRNNFVIQLQTKYNQQSYDQYLIKRIRRAEKWEMDYKKSIDYSKIIRLYKKWYAHKIGGFKPKDYQHFETLCDMMHKNKKVICREIHDASGKELLAAVLLLKNKNRLYNMISVVSESGKKMLANYFLFDQIIREFSGNDLLLDLEGSDVKGIAYFYEKFSTENQIYPFIKWNRLPKIVKLLKS